MSPLDVFIRTLGLAASASVLANIRKAEAKTNIPAKFFIDDLLVSDDGDDNNKTGPPNQPAGPA